jgi:hypothetical protein
MIYVFVCSERSLRVTIMPPQPERSVKIESARAGKWIRTISYVDIPSRFNFRLLAFAAICLSGGFSSRLDACVRAQVPVSA